MEPAARECGTRCVPCGAVVLGMSQKARDRCSCHLRCVRTGTRAQGMLCLGRSVMMDIEFDRVWFAYRRKPALRDVSWSFGGGVTGLLGPNGAGKTTLLSVLTTMARPKSGSVWMNEHDLATAAGRAAARPLLGFVPQRFNLAPEMRVHATIAYAGWVNGLPDRACDQAADRALERAGLADKTRAWVRSLSGGQRQRMGIAAGLVHDPEVLVLDEPTVGLDPGQRLRVRELIAELGTQRSVVISSHMLDDISYLCHRVGVLARGKLVFTGGVDELTRLIGATEGDADSPGSSFERAYDRLVADLEDVE